MRQGQEAADYARGRVGDHMAAAGYCLQFTRENYPISSYYASAIDAWYGANYVHEDDENPPVGVPVFYWSSNPYRHVAIYVGNRQVVTTYNDEIRLYGWDAMEGPFGQYMGWTEDLNEKRVWSPPEPEPPKPPVIEIKERDVFVTTYGSSTARLVTGGVIVGIEMDTYNKLKAAGIPAVALKNAEVERLQSLLTFDKEPYKVKVVD
jgi:hypothetical protein